MTKGKEGSGSKGKVPISMKHVTGGGRYPSALLGVSSPGWGKLTGWTSAANNGETPLRRWAQGLFDMERTRRRMPYNFDDVLVRCPYFRYRGKLDIVCESAMDEGTTSSHRFKTVRARKAHQERYCNGDYTQCRHCQATDRKY